MTWRRLAVPWAVRHGEVMDEYGSVWRTQADVIQGMRVKFDTRRIVQLGGELYEAAAVAAGS